MSGHIFVSYTRDDGDFALRLARDLRASGVDIWMDQLDIRPGDVWDQAVEGALRSCAGLLLVLSPRSVASRSVLDEVSYSIEENKSVIPVVMEACDVPFRLRRVQRTDFTRGYDSGFANLMKAFGRPAPARGHGAARATHAPGRTQAPSPVPRSRRLVTALWWGLAGCLFAGAGLQMIFANDPRMDTSAAPDIVTMSVVGAVLAGCLWAIAGAIGAGNRTALVAAVSMSLIALLCWIGIGGTYQDVMATGLFLGWPLGGVAGAVLGRKWST